MVRVQGAQGKAGENSTSCQECSGNDGWIHGNHNVKKWPHAQSCCESESNKDTQANMLILSIVLNRKQCQQKSEGNECGQEVPLQELREKVNVSSSSCSQGRNGQATIDILEVVPHRLVQSVVQGPEKGIQAKRGLHVPPAFDSMLLET